jgi:hypothetical protein
MNIAPEMQCDARWTMQKIRVRMRFNERKNVCNKKEQERERERERRRRRRGRKGGSSER